MRKASIDIGTNSTRLLIADIDKALVPLLYRQTMTRLGQGLSESGCLQPAAMYRVLSALKAYKELGQTCGVNEYRVFATSAARDARNQIDFIDRIKTSAGFDCRVISGEEEALLSFLGAVSDINSTGVLVCDIGGGSTEFIVGENNTLCFHQSLNIGSRRLTERFFHHDPVLPQEIKAAKAGVRQQLVAIEKADVDVCVSVGGTATSCAMIEQNIAVDKADQAHHVELKKHAVDDLVNRLARLRNAERKELVGLEPERADVILMGALILQMVLEHFEMKKSVISIRDLLFGALLQ